MISFALSILVSTSTAIAHVPMATCTCYGHGGVKLGTVSVPNNYYPGVMEAAGMNACWDKFAGPKRRIDEIGSACPEINDGSPASDYECIKKAPQKKCVLWMNKKSGQTTTTDPSLPFIMTPPPDSGPEGHCVNGGQFGSCTDGSGCCTGQLCSDGLYCH